MPSHRTRRKQYKPWGRQARFEMAITIAVLLAIIATVVIFLFVYHDFPMRIS
jgi:hypothetical protein